MRANTESRDHQAMLLEVGSRSSGRVGVAGAAALFIDAGVGHIRVWASDAEGKPVLDETISSGADLPALFASLGLTGHFGHGNEAPVYITGKLAGLVRDALGAGKPLLPAATAWLAARDSMLEAGNANVRALAVVDLSASGYQLVGVDRSGALKEDLLVVNPRCGAGSGMNLDRVLQKLGLARGEVDTLLADYAGEAGRDRRAGIQVRADRCGVFASSATISDKNQGIPLEVALATTLKSEVLKACHKLPAGFDKVRLTGRVFHWRFARDCAEDHLRAQGVEEIEYDPDNGLVLGAMHRFVQSREHGRIAAPEPRLIREPAPQAYPAMAELMHRYQADHRYLRLPDEVVGSPPTANRPAFLALDVGSTMAKAVLTDVDGGEVRFRRAYSNSGDTIETVKQVFRELAHSGLDRLTLRGIGITGSARFQVQQALEHIYPELAGRISVLVENYAHARGSIRLAREHVQRLKEAGVAEVNEDFCILVDIGGEDTKISSIALKEAELFGNAMNLKCSAGTGSLMDTLCAMFGQSDVAAACAEAQAAPRGLAINATCAVFLMENARKLQLQGVPRAEIMASANWAIVENMARTLWNQLELPSNAVVLLHGQTMLSDPLPVAVTHRLQSFLEGPAYVLVPPSPGHRACFGLLNTLAQTAPEGAAEIALAKFLDTRFEKRIITCKGAVCEDKTASCNRSHLTCRGEDGRKKISFTIGGCSAVNELLSRKASKTAAPVQVRDTYKEIWDFINARQPHSDDPDRLVIPRSFAVSEWSYLLARIFERLGLPVHVDAVRGTDLTDAQGLFNVDTCAPHMGAVGQYSRLATAPHGMILAPQIEFLPSAGGGSLGRTCTINQGGVAVALNLARVAVPESRFHLFNIDLSQLDPDQIAAQLRSRLGPVYRHYRLADDTAALREAIAGALADHEALRAEAAELAADMAEEALAQDIPVAVVVGREYILTPGIYDSHVRRLLRDKQMVVLPSYVLDMELNPDYGHLYWRNPHFIVSLLDAVAKRELHAHLRHPRLSEAFRRIENGPDLLPVVQVSTFSCGPDSVVQPFIAEIMKRRPFLLIQSDAVIKELAHLENRVNTYVKQMELGLHERLDPGGEEAFRVRTLDDLLLNGPIDKARDVLYFPTLSDNRTLTAVMRGAGFTCIDNYADDEYDLQSLVKQGRRSTGDAVCAPLAAVWADLERAEADFVRRQAAGDPLLAGRRRLLYFDNTGPGPCRQGQYTDVHQLLYQQRNAKSGGREGCPSPGQSVLRFLIGQETEGYDIGVDEWVLARAHMALILQGVLHAVLFKGGAACRDYEEYQRFQADYRALKTELCCVLESFHGPSRLGRLAMAATGKLPGLVWLAKYAAYRLNDHALKRPLRRFADTWLRGREPAGQPVQVALAGEVYMRAAQAEDVFRILLANLGFGRFRLEYTPVWNYMEWAFDEAIDVQRERLGRLSPQQVREAGETRARIRLAGTLQFILRNLMARPLYRAAGLGMPAATRKVLRASRELIPTLRPLSEIATYAGEALGELRHGVEVVLNVAPNGCMVATMGEALTPAISELADGRGRIQHLFSADGDVNDELLTMALLKALGPERYYSLGGARSGLREAPVQVAGEVPVQAVAGSVAEGRFPA